MNLPVSAKGKISQQARPRELAWVLRHVFSATVFRNGHQRWLGIRMLKNQCLRRSIRIGTMVNSRYASNGIVYVGSVFHAYLQPLVFHLRSAQELPCD